MHFPKKGQRLIQEYFSILKMVDLILKIDFGKELSNRI